jgi:hypothetical protein
MLSKRGWIILIAIVGSLLVIGYCMITYVPTITTALTDWHTAHSDWEIYLVIGMCVVLLGVVVRAYRKNDGCRTLGPQLCTTGCHWNDLVKKCVR